MARFTPREHAELVESIAANPQLDIHAKALQMVAVSLAALQDEGYYATEKVIYTFNQVAGGFDPGSN